MGRDIRTELIQCLHLMIGPVVRFCLRRSISVQDFIEAARVVFVHAAADEITERGKRVNISKLSVVTGLQRRAIERIYREGEVNSAESRIDRVIGQWRYDRRFLTSTGKPKVLSLEGENSSFNRLVRSVSKELHPASVLFELERLGAAERTPNGVKLIAAAYEPRKSYLESMKLLSRDVNDLMAAVLSNVEAPADEEPLNFHAASIFDNIPEEDLPKIRSWFLQTCSNFHTRVEKYLAEKDLDMSPKSGSRGGKRVVFTSFTKTD